MQDRMLLVSEDVGGVLDAEKYVQTSAVDRASLEQALAVNEGRLDFLYQVRNPQNSSEESLRWLSCGMLRSKERTTAAWTTQYRHEVDDAVLEAALNAKLWTKRMEATAEKANLKVMKERMGHEVYLRKRTVALTELITELLQKVGTTAPSTSARQATQPSAQGAESEDSEERALPRLR